MIAYPFKQQKFQEATIEQQIKDSVYLILSTYPGERVLLPQFGCRLKDFVFEPNTQDTQQSMEREVIASLTRWEPRICNIKIVSKSYQDAIDLTISYTLCETMLQDEVIIRM